MKLVARGHVFDFPRRPLVMGIVNLGADSFSGDGLPDIAAALAHARALVADGADIVDIGAESARTNRGPVSEEDEAAQLLRFIERWDAPVPLSVNTWRPGVVRRVLPRGGHLLNDISGLPTDENARICAGTGAALLIMHTVGQPKVAHTHIGYTDVMAELASFFREKLALAAAAGLPRDATVLDPGLDFAKQRDDNLRILRDLARLTGCAESSQRRVILSAAKEPVTGRQTFEPLSAQPRDSSLRKAPFRMTGHLEVSAEFDRPLLLPVSRKTVIGDVLGLPPAERDAGTVACLVAGAMRGANIFRVHNVRAAAQAISMLAAVGEPQ